MAGISRIVRPKRSSNLTVSPVGFGLTAGRGTPTVSTGTATFDYYIGPSGSDSNPGTQGSPWAITALWTKAATYAGKRLGILDGTYHGYNGTLYNATYDAAYYIPATAAGTSGARTVIGGVTSRGAVLVGDGGNMSGWTRAKTGLWCTANYVTIQDLHFRESGVFGLLITATNARVSRNHIERVDRVTYGDNGYDNQCGMHFAVSAANAWVDHNYVHDIVVGGGGGHNESAIQLYQSPNCLVEYNECSDVNAGIYLKENCGGGIVRYNYVHGTSQALYGGTNDVFAATWHNNVVENWDGYLYNVDSGRYEIAPTAFYNNTFIFSASCVTGFWVRASSGAAVSFYNNLLRRQGGSSSSGGDMGVEASAGFNVVDYNLYGTDTTFFLPSYTPVANFAAWKTAIGSKDAHSLNSNPTFVGGGSGVGPYQWRLSGGSAGENAGSSDGTTSGSAVNIGAFASSGQTEQIGPLWRWPA